MNLLFAFAGHHSRQRTQSNYGIRKTQESCNGNRSVQINGTSDGTEQNSKFYGTLLRLFPKKTDTLRHVNWQSRDCSFRTFPANKVGEIASTFRTFKFMRILLKIYLHNLALYAIRSANCNWFWFSSNNLLWIISLIRDLLSLATRMVMFLVDIDNNPAGDGKNSYLATMG